MTDLPASLCTICGAPMYGDRATWTVCQESQTWIAERLDRVYAYWLQLPDHLVPEKRQAGQRVSGSPQGGRIPPSEAVLDLIGPGGAADRLAPYALALGRAYPATRPDRQNTGLATDTAGQRMSRIVATIETALPLACQSYPDLHPLAMELKTLVGELRAATADDRNTVALGPCPETREDGSACDAFLRYNRERHSVRCYNGHQVDVAAYIRPAA